MDWKKLERVAEEQVAATLAELPEQLRTRAASVAVTAQQRPNSRQLADGIEPDTLGLFVGPEYSEQETTTFPVPPQVILFLENLWAFSEEDLDVFAEEVRVTLMHELGHYLGLNEDDLFDRGLD